MPRQHLLSDIVARFPLYGQNLVALAQGLAREGTPLGMVDVGANIGDSAAQVLAAVDAQILCVEGDRFWLPFLNRNVGGDQRVSVLPALLVVDDAAAMDEVRAVRTGGTTSFQTSDRSGQDEPMPTLFVSQLPPLKAPVRLVKSDTDGYDARLIPALARRFAESTPVLFFEFDPELSERAGDPDVVRVWSQLEALGYDDVVVWDNFGDVLGRTVIAELPDLMTEFDRPVNDRGWHYWDVAAAHRDDDAGAAVLRDLAGAAGRLGGQS
jgi:FkbM family methyltransferase